MARIQKRRLALAVVALMVAGRPSAAPASSPRPEIAIVVSTGRFPSVESAAASIEQVDWWDADTRDDDACTESFAALELRRRLARAGGIDPGEIEFSTESAMPRAATVLILGSRHSQPLLKRFAGGRPVAGPGGSPEAFRLHIRRAGGQRLITIEGASRVGTLYGVDALLEHLGVRYYGLGEAGTVDPVRLSWPDTLDREETPGFEIRGFWAWEPRGTDDFFVWMAHNRLNLWTAAETDGARLAQLGIHQVAGGHGLQKDLLDPDVYFAAHPEWYGLVAGQRSAALGAVTGDNFCTSNLEAVGQYCRSLVARLTSGPWRHADIVALWMLDGGRWCECPACRALGAPTDRLLALAATVTDSLRAARRRGVLARPVTVTTLAFLETLTPPAAPIPSSFAGGDFAMTWFPIYRCYAHALDDPACREINVTQARIYSQWRDRCAGGKVPLEVGEYYGLGEFHLLPVLLTRVIAADIPWYWAHGARRFHWMHVPTRQWGPWTLTQALLARLLWNPAAPAAAIEDEFFARYYPATGDSTRLAYARIETALANLKILVHRVQVGSAVFRLGQQIEKGGSPYGLRHFQHDPRGGENDAAPSLTEMESASVEAVALLEAAASRASDPRERARLADDRARAEHARATIEFFVALIDTYEADRLGHPDAARAAWPRLARAAETLRGVTDVVHGSASDAEAANALEATGMLAEYGKLEQRYR